MGSAGVSEEEVGAGVVLGGDDFNELSVGDEDEAAGGRRWHGGRQEAQHDAQGDLGNEYMCYPNYTKKSIKPLEATFLLYL